MKLQDALREALASGDHDRMRAAGARVHYVGVLDVHGEGPRRRTIPAGRWGEPPGSLQIDAEAFAPVVDAVASGDLQRAAQVFEEAFALSYGVNDVEMIDVETLTIEPATG